MTSPVERISGPRSSAPGKRSLGKIASFAHARVGAARSGQVEVGQGLPEQEPAGELD
jgi:hypothetical protein